ncbi:GATOR complex protein WDR59-like isoform X3 [Dreissena polymorpha]|uniref:GATOR complex protein WDR59-like isoform X3 n=1 Tax=Dreissena polymorpha TaxID=45954 RepID=UPI002264D22B|nr:GATOR complex protein WDR59-like isoform X3 [Dreissena polymorpha]
MSQWGESVTVEFGDLQATCMGLDCLGKWAVLPGRRVLALVDLDNPVEKVHRLTRQSKYDISCVQWNPHASHAHWFSSASMHKLELYSWDNASSKQVCTMKAHTRNISDIDWSPFDVNVIASCSVDAYTLLWDVREPKRPCASFQSVCGASQVKWNKVTNNMFATSHEGDVRIWDPRKGNTPVLYHTAHLAKIHGLDWSPFKENCFTTASQDGSAKFWDHTNFRQYKGMLKSGLPVWRAKYTPFGDGLISVVMSTLSRGDNSLFMWNNLSLNEPVHQFVGHMGTVVEYMWRKKKEDEKDYQLVSWSRDQNLKIWKVDSQLQRLCGHEVLDCVDETLLESTDSTREVLQSMSAPEVTMGTSQSERQTMTLMQEFSLVNKFIPNVTINVLDSANRYCSMSINSGKHAICVTVTFPEEYPNNAPPNFDLTSSTGLPPALIKKLLRVMNETIQKSVKKNLNCLEPCIRQVASAFDSMNLEERKTPDTDPFPVTGGFHAPFIHPLPFSGYQDNSIPFPRTCGAQFNSVGLLICFRRSKEAIIGEEKTPKALSELAVISSTNRVRSATSSASYALYSRSPPTPKSEIGSVGQWYIQNKRQRTKSRTFKDIPEGKRSIGDKDRVVKDKKRKGMRLEPVLIYDTHYLLNIHRELGEKYSLNLNNLTAMCEHNKIEAASVGRRDLVRLWSLIPVIHNPSLHPDLNPDAGTPWAQRPLGRGMVESLMNHYKSIGDIQTLAMLCCVFWDRNYFQSLSSLNSNAIKKSASKVSLEFEPVNFYNPYHTVSSMSGLLRSFNMSDNALSPSSQLTTISSPMATIAMAPNSSTPSRAMVKLKRSNSYNDLSFEDYKFADESQPKETIEEQERKQHESNCRMLDPSKYVQFDHMLKVYADILARWGLRNQAAHIKKHVTVRPQSHSGIEFGVRCFKCETEVRGVKCTNCGHPAFHCAICHTGVKGSSNFCLNCGHGGHSSHMQEWFKHETQCPSGCGCLCLKWNPF